MKIAEAAKYLSTSTKGVWRHIHAGRLRVVWIDPDARIDKDDLDLFIARCKV